MSQTRSGSGGARSKARKRALDLLYAAEMHTESPVATLGRAEQSADGPMNPYVATLVHGVAADQAFIDDLLDRYAHGWSLARMPTVDRNVLRMGVWEVFHADDVPDHVVLTEAVALVRELSTDDSPVFVNGVLGGIVRDRDLIVARRAAAYDAESLEVEGLRVYRDALVASWHALLDAWPGADLAEGEGWVASRCPDPIFTNGVLERSEALPELLAHLADRPAYAVWTWAEDTATAARGAGLVPDEQTVPMVLSLSEWSPSVPAATEVERDADPAVVAELNALPPETLNRAHPRRCYLTSDHACGLLVLGDGPDRNLSMVVTRPDRRRGGLASGLVTAALADLAVEGARSVSLQATPAGQGIYARLGFVAVGAIQEWVPA